MSSPHPVSGEIRLDRTHEAAGELLLKSPLLQEPLLGSIRQTAEFDERRGNVESRQHGEITGLPPCEVQQDVSDIARLPREVDPPDQIGSVLACCECRGLAVRRLSLLGKYRKPAHFRVPKRIRVN